MTETIKKLKALPTDKWFTVITKSGVNLTEIVKELIDNGEHFEFSDDWQRIKRLYDPFITPYYPRSDIINTK